MGGAGAYFVSRAGAEKLLSWEDLARPVDTLMMDPAARLFDQLSIIQSVPGLCTTPAAPTSDSDLRQARHGRYELTRNEYHRRVGVGPLGFLRRCWFAGNRRLAEWRSVQKARRLENVRGAVRITIPFSGE